MKLPLQILQPKFEKSQIISEIAPANPFHVGRYLRKGNEKDETLAGYPLEDAPDFTGYVRGQYTQPLSDYGKLLFSSIINYRSRAYFDVGDQLPDAARMLLSARIQWNSATGKYSVAAYGENLTGKEYYLSRTLQVTGGFQVPAPPRVGYITANVKF